AARRGEEAEVVGEGVAQRQDFAQSPQSVLGVELVLVTSAPGRLDDHVEQTRVGVHRGQIVHGSRHAFTPPSKPRASALQDCVAEEVPLWQKLCPRTNGAPAPLALLTRTLLDPPMRTGLDAGTAPAGRLACPLTS